MSVAERLALYKLAGIRIGKTSGKEVTDNMMEKQISRFLRPHYGPDFSAIGVLECIQELPRAMKYIVA